MRSGFRLREGERFEPAVSVSGKLSQVEGIMAAAAGLI
jgi:hypothetical protein